MRLRVWQGRALLGEPGGEHGPDEAALPPDLSHALEQWAWVVDRVRRAAELSPGSPGDSRDADAVSRRGHQLAALVAACRNETLDYEDPISGAVYRLEAGGDESTDSPDLEPEPWGTGLTVSAIVAVLVAIADVALSRSVASLYGWLWVPLNLLFGVGLAPSLWLLRGVPFWRWSAYGTAVGLALGWLSLSFAGT